MSITVYHNVVKITAMYLELIIDRLHVLHIRDGIENLDAADIKQQMLIHSWNYSYCRLPNH